MGGLLSSFRDSETVWYLSAAGRREIESDKVRKKTLHVRHTLLRNEYYIEKQPAEFRVEFTLKWDSNVIIADALYRMKKFDPYRILEVDISQSMASNIRKIALYKELRDSGRWRNGPFPFVTYVTVNESRAKRLNEALRGIGEAIIL